MVPVIVVEGDGVERRVDFAESLSVAQFLHKMLPGIGPHVPVGAGQHADAGGLFTGNHEVGLWTHDRTEDSHS